MNRAHLAWRVSRWNVGGFSKWDERFVSSGEFDPGGDGAGRENFRP